MFFYSCDSGGGNKSPGNTAPVADAGPDQTAFVTETVVLDGSGSSDVDGNPLTYSWALTTKPSGSEAKLSDPTSVTPSFVVDVFGTYTAQLIVNDGLLDSDPDFVTIDTENSAPVADAGPDQTAFVTETVVLDGSGSSDVDGNPLTYSWALTTKPSGSEAKLSDPTAIDPTFDVDVSGTYVAQLIVNDGMLDSDPDFVTIDTVNSKPVADAGPDQIAVITETVVLDGSGSYDVDNDPLTYSWSFTTIPRWSRAKLDDPTSVTPSFVADLYGTYVAQLIVNDGLLDSDPDTVMIIVKLFK